MNDDRLVNAIATAIEHLDRAHLDTETTLRKRVALVAMGLKLVLRTVLRVRENDEKATTTDP